MVKKILYTLVCVLFLAACASLPEQEYNQAKENREIIAKHNLNTYFPDEYTKAESDFSQGEQNYDKDNAKAKKDFDSANALYQQIIHDAYPLYVDSEKTGVDSEREKAVDIKANVAVKDDFAKADEEYQTALSLSKEGKYEEALDHLNQAKTLFEGAYNAAKEKHDKARNSIDSAQDRINKVDQMINELEGEDQ
jgi:tetratricopeptide (TPR) repeat protein